MMENDFTYDDYLTAMEQMKKLGSLSKIIDMIPGVPKEMKEIDFDAGEKQLSRVKAIIYSMTAKERKKSKAYSRIFIKKEENCYGIWYIITRS